MARELIRNDMRAFLFWGLIAFLVFNFLPSLAVVLFVLGLSYKYITAKSKVVYFAVFLVLLADLAGLFGEKRGELFSIGPVEIDILVIFVFSSYVKIIITPKHLLADYHFQKPTLVFFLYTVFLVLLGVFIGVEPAGESGLRHHFQLIRFAMLMPVFLVLPKVITAKRFTERISAIIFVALFFNIAGQVFMLIIGVPVSQYINPDPAYGSVVGELVNLHVLIRPILAPWIPLLALFLAYFHIINRTPCFGNRYLYFVIIFSFLSIFITATRGWILGFSIFISLCSLLFFSRATKQIVRGFALGIIVFLLLYLTSNAFQLQIDKSFERVSTLSLVLEGDISAGETSIRHVRGATVMELFHKSPIVGLGFSSRMLHVADQHVGNQMILASGGIIGYLVFLYFLFTINARTLQLGEKVKADPRISYFGELKIIPALFIMLFVIHSTSTVLFGYAAYVIAAGNMMWIVITLGVINKILNEYYE